MYVSKQYEILSVNLLQKEREPRVSVGQLFRYADGYCWCRLYCSFIADWINFWCCLELLVRQEMVCICSPYPNFLQVLSCLLSRWYSVFFLTRSTVLLTVISWTRSSQHLYTLCMLALVPSLWTLVLPFLHLISLAQQSCWNITAQRQVKRIREEYLKAIMRQEVGWFDQNQSGAITSRLAG